MPRLYAAVPLLSFLQVLILKVDKVICFLSDYICDSEGLARAIGRGGVYIISACGGWSRGGGGIILGGILRVEAIRTTEIEEWRVPGRVEESEV